MSFCSFRRIFWPTKEEIIKDLEMLVCLHEESIGQCSTCIHHEESHMPGFITDFGECKKKIPLFYTKVISFDNKKLCCRFYEEDTKYVELWKQQIKRLKGE